MKERKEERKEEKKKKKKKRKGTQCYDFVWIVWMAMILYGKV